VFTRYVQIVDQVVTHFILQPARASVLLCFMIALIQGAKCARLLSLTVFSVFLLVTSRSQVVIVLPV
jgi:hypothetical protein